MCKNQIEKPFFASSVKYKHEGTTSTLSQKLSSS